MLISSSVSWRGEGSNPAFQHGRSSFVHSCITVPYYPLRRAMFSKIPSDRLVVSPALLLNILDCTVKMTLYFQARSDCLSKSLKGLVMRRNITLGCLTSAIYTANGCRTVGGSGKGQLFHRVCDGPLLLLDLRGA